MLLVVAHDFQLTLSGIRFQPALSCGPFLIATNSNL